MVESGNSATSSPALVGGLARRPAGGKVADGDRGGADRGHREALAGAERAPRLALPGRAAAPAELLVEPGQLGRGEQPAAQVGGRAGAGAVGGRVRGRLRVGRGRRLGGGGLGRRGARCSRCARGRRARRGDVLAAGRFAVSFGWSVQPARASAATQVRVGRGHGRACQGTGQSHGFPHCHGFARSSVGLETPTRRHRGGVSRYGVRASPPPAGRLPRPPDARRTKRCPHGHDGTHRTGLGAPLLAALLLCLLLAACTSGGDPEPSPSAAPTTASTSASRRAGHAALRGVRRAGCRRGLPAARLDVHHRAPRRHRQGRGRRRRGHRGGPAWTAASTRAPRPTCS